jgi:Flp pilus assembly pilin Flp
LLFPQPKDTLEEGESMPEALSYFVQNEEGQDLIEYTLLLAFVCLAATGLFVNSGKSISGIWTAANSRLVVANTAAS